jgi:hypothetical protein
MANEARKSVLLPDAVSFYTPATSYPAFRSKGDQIRLLACSILIACRDRQYSVCNISGDAQRTITARHIPAGVESDPKQKTLPYYILSDVNSLKGKVCSGRIISIQGNPFARYPLFAYLKGLYCLLVGGLIIFCGHCSAVIMQAINSPLKFNSVPAFFWVTCQASVVIRICNLRGPANISIRKITKVFHKKNLASVCMMSSVFAFSSLILTTMHRTGGYIRWRV